MSISQPGNRLWIAVFAYLLIAGGTARAQPEPKPEGSADKAAEIKILIKQRREALKTILDLLVAQARTGRGVDFHSVFKTQRELLQATLDLDESPEARMEALRDQLKIAQEFAKLTEAGLEIGTVSQVDALRAKVGVLEARIELLREELKAKTGK